LTPIVTRSEAKNVQRPTLNAQRSTLNEECQGGELNSRPTPNAFGAALQLLQVKDSQLRILLPLQLPLNLSSFFQHCYLFLRDYFKFFSEPLCRCRVTPQMLRKSGIKLDS
jgi:hypothetical protein